MAKGTNLPNCFLRPLHISITISTETDMNTNKWVALQIHTTIVHIKKQKKIHKKLKLSQNSFACTAKYSTDGEN